MWIPTNYSVDHFQPKVKYPNRAYEWSNYRLALDSINSNKGESEIVLDPFVVRDGWFVLDKASLWVHPEPTLSAAISARVQTTINVLKLNSYRLVNFRFEVLRGYIEGKQPLGSIEQKYPFIAAEIKRQGIKTAAQTAAEKAAAKNAPKA